MALADKVRRDQKFVHLRAAIVDYEAEFGEITKEEIVARRRADREGALVVGDRRSDAAGPTRRGGKAKSA